MSEIDQYDYEVPRELIAQRPLLRRSDARLLVVHRDRCSLEHTHVRNLPEVLRPGDCLVLNDTRVIPARLVGYRTATRGRWSGLFLSVDDEGNWKVLSKTRGKLMPGETVTIKDHKARDTCRLLLLTKLPGGLWAARPEADEPAMQLLDRIGRVPLPPYIRDGEMVDADRENYQTVFAEQAGAVAAPTAGLHFTKELLQRLESTGVRICRITLHVGLGTFRPVSVSRLSEHQMHSEWGCITSETVEELTRLRNAGGRIVAVGTTAVRTLETAAAEGVLQPWEGETDLFIRPPYAFKAVDALMTNFHWPRSTLLVLVSAIGGHELIQRAYQEAIREGYRFFSYGDAMLIL
jgi:S-adenosylmethionine:tRNA ribosyltransferase-isomerase